MKEFNDQKTREVLHKEIGQYRYHRNMGNLRPKFQGIPQDYYPLKWTQILVYSLLVFMIIGAALGLMIALLIWVTTKGLKEYVITWSIVFLMLAIVMMILTYLGGKNRIRQVKRLIQQSQHKHEQLAAKKDMQK